MGEKQHFAFDQPELLQHGFKIPGQYVNASQTFHIAAYIRGGRCMACALLLMGGSAIHGGIVACTAVVQSVKPADDDEDTVDHNKTASRY